MPTKFPRFRVYCTLHSTCTRQSTISKEAVTIHICRESYTGSAQATTRRSCQSNTCGHSCMYVDVGTCSGMIHGGKKCNACVLSSLNHNNVKTAAARTPAMIYLYVSIYFIDYVLLLASRAERLCSFTQRAATLTKKIIWEKKNKRESIRGRYPAVFFSPQHPAPHIRA